MTNALDHANNAAGFTIESSFSAQMRPLEVSAMRLRLIAQGLETLERGERVSVLDTIGQRWNGWSRNDVRCYDLEVRRKADPKLGYRFTGALVHDIAQGRGLRLERWCDDVTLETYEVALDPSSQLIASLRRSDPIIAIKLFFTLDTPPTSEPWFDGATTESLHHVTRRRRIVGWPK